MPCGCVAHLYNQKNSPGGETSWICCRRGPERVRGGRGKTAPHRVDRRVPGRRAWSEKNMCCLGFCVCSGAKMGVCVIRGRCLREGGWLLSARVESSKGGNRSLRCWQVSEGNKSGRPQIEAQIEHGGNCKLRIRAACLGAVIGKLSGWFWSRRPLVGRSRAVVVTRAASTHTTHDPRMPTHESRMPTSVQVPRKELVGWSAS